MGHIFYKKINASALCPCHSFGELLADVSVLCLSLTLHRLFSSPAARVTTIREKYQGILWMAREI